MTKSKEQIELEKAYEIEEYKQRIEREEEYRLGGIKKYRHKPTNVFPKKKKRKKR